MFKRIKNLGPEERLILLCAGFKTDVFIKRGIKELSINPLGWKKILNLAARHRISPLVYYNLDRIGASDIVPQNAWRILENSYYSNLKRNINLSNELLQILKSANDANVSVIPLKGTILMEELYHNPGLRTITDIDMLVKTKELSKVKGILLRLGYNENLESASAYYRKNYKTEFVFYKKISAGLVSLIEIHNALVPARPYKIILPLWERTQEKSFQDAKVRTLSLEDTLLSCALHLRRHTNRLFLKFIVDIDAILNKKKNILDWDYIEKMSKKNRILTTLYFALYISKELFYSPVSESILERFKPNLLKDKLMRLSMNKYNFLIPKKWQGIILRILLFDRIFVELPLYLWKVAFLERLIAKKIIKRRDKITDVIIGQ